MLSVLAGIGVGFIKDLVASHGEALVVEGVKRTTGIDLSKPELTAEDKQKILDAEIEIMKLDFEKLKEENRAIEFTTIENNKNTASARENNSKVQESENSSKLAKVAAYYIDFFVISATMVLALIILFVDIPEGNVQIVNIMFGAMLGYVGTIINYHRGSSNGSAMKTEVIMKGK